MAIQTYEIEAFVGEWCAWEYDITAIQRDYEDGMSEKEFAKLCEYHNIHKRAIKCINDAYEKVQYNRYENCIERWSKKLGISYNKLEDDATEVRELGFDRC